MLTKQDLSTGSAIGTRAVLAKQSYSSPRSISCVEIDGSCLYLVHSWVSSKSLRKYL